MATHSSVLAWRIPGTGVPGGLPSMGSTESYMIAATQQQQQQQEERKWRFSSMEGEEKHNRKCTGRRTVHLDLRHNLSMLWILSSSPSYIQIIPKSHFFLSHSHGLEQAILYSLMKSCFLRPIELFPSCRGFFSSLGLFSTHSISLFSFHDSSVHLLSCVQLFVTPWTAACQAFLSITNTQSLLKLMSIKSVMPSNHLIPLSSLLLLPSIFPSIRVFSNESVLGIKWPKYWSFSSASVLPMNIQDWFPLGKTGLSSLQFKGLSRVFSNSTVQKHQFFIKSAFQNHFWISNS